MITFQYGTKKPQMIPKSHPKFSEIVDLVITQKDLEAAYELVDLKAVVTKAITGSNIALQGNTLYYKGEEVHGLLGQRILEIHRLGLPVDTLIAFLDNLMNNPSKRAVDELYGFLESSRLPITDDGHFLAYKSVRSDYKDKHSGTIDNSVGQVVSMSRNKVADNKDVTCSNGLHFAAHEYASGFGGGSDRMMIMKINPRDVVSIPSDYNNQKGRCCEYIVHEEVKREDSRLVGAQVVNTGSIVSKGNTGSIVPPGYTRNTGSMPVDGDVEVICIRRDGSEIKGLAKLWRWAISPAAWFRATNITFWKLVPKAPYEPQTDNYDDTDVFDAEDGEFWGEAEEFPVNRKSTYSLLRHDDNGDIRKGYGKNWFFTAYDVKHDNLVFRKWNGGDFDFDYVTVADTDNWEILVTKVVLGS